MASTEIMEHEPAKPDRGNSVLKRMERLAGEYGVYESRNRGFAIAWEKTLEMLVALLLIIPPFCLLTFLIVRDLRRRGELFDGESLPLWTCSCGRCAWQRLDPYNQVSYWACRIWGVKIEPVEVPGWKRRGLARLMFGNAVAPGNVGGAEEWMRGYGDG